MTQAFVSAAEYLETAARMALLAVGFLVTVTIVAIEAAAAGILFIFTMRFPR